MASEILMPQLSDTMKVGKILKWLKNEGDTVKRGDILAEVETEKANLEIESFSSGVLLKIVTPAGSEAEVGKPIAFVGAQGETIQTSAPSPISAPASADQNPVIPKAEAVQVATTVQSVTTSSSDRLKASPLAKKIAQEKQIDLSLVQGTGPNGRIVKRDLENLAILQSKPTSQTPPTSPQQKAGSLTPLSKMRETIARRMQESVTESPHFYVTTSVNMTQALKLRETLKKQPGYEKVSINHLILKATAYGLSKEPRVNCAYRDGQLYSPDSINLGIITAVEDGLLIPVVREADKLSLKDLAFEAKAAVERAKAGRPTSADLSGGTFSISNMGMFDVENFTAIINPGQGGVLAVSSVKETPIVEDGKIVIANIMKLTVSVDHRIIDGVMAASFLQHVKEALETPALLFI
jgi:pyruvate dehydrogenase E2 component (dihydrolipoamide acetyltransferase)